MAEVKPLHFASGAISETPAADTLPVSNIPTLTSAKISDFTEAAQDAVGGSLTDSDTIDFTYTDGSNTISAAARVQMSVTSDTSGLKLSGDAASPGNSTYYGTNAGGTKGFHALPSASAAETRTMTAGEAISARDLVYVSASNTVMKAVANSASKFAVGIAVSAISNGATGTITFPPIVVSGFTGLTVGSRYYLSASTAGAVTTTPPSGDNEFSQFVGVALTTTEMLVNISPEYVIRRS